MDMKEGAAFYPVAPISTKFAVGDDVLDAQIAGAISRGLPDFFNLPGIGKWKGRPAALAAGGPSLRTTLGELREIPDVIACGSTHDYLIENGVIPKYAVCCDPEPSNSASFYRRPDKRVTYLIASCCHADVFDALAGQDVYLWHTAGAGTQFPEGTRTIGGGCTVTLKAINLAIVMGYFDLHFFGFDSSFADGEDHAYAHPVGRKVMPVKIGHDGRVYQTSPEFLAQAQHFQEMVREHGRMFNPIVHGDGLIAGMMDYGVRMMEHERDKYRTIWDKPAYRDHSPGMEAMPVAAVILKDWGAGPGDCVYDFGCGEGLAVAQFRAWGMVAVGIDFAGNAPRADLNIPFLEADLTDLPTDPDFWCDWGYCTDVMEHIPPQKIDDVLAGIVRSVCRGVIFTIACFPDSMGALIGETLHLTVQPPEWWRAKLAEYWPSVEMRVEPDTDKPRIIVGCRNAKELVNE